LTQVSFVLSQSTRLTDRQTDEQTDRQTERPLNTVRCITCIRTVKNGRSKTLESPCRRRWQHVARVRQSRRE